MLTPKEKAKELVDMFWSVNPKFKLGIGSPNYDEAKHCALKCIDEILKSNPLKGMYGLDRSYYYEVKKEINKL